MNNREALLVAAKQCLLEKGYARTTARDIASAAKVSLAAIGYHFSSKDALLTEVAHVLRACRYWARTGPRHLADQRISGRLGRATMVVRRRPAGVEEQLGTMGRLEFVLRFTLSHPGLSSTIVGTSSLDHLRANLAIAEKGPLPTDVYEEAKRRLDSVNP